MSGKKYSDAAKKYDKTQLHEPAKAFELVKSLASRNFDETVEVAFRLGVDPRKADQMLRSTVSLPAGTGKDVRVAVFATGDAAQEARDAGADVVGADDLVKQVSEGFLDFDIAIATPDLMGQVGRLGRVLGPRGLMPNPKTGTVTTDVAAAVKEIKAGKVEFRTDKTALVHVPVGKLSFDPQKLVDNAMTIVSAVLKAKPSAAKGKYVKGITLSSSMGPGIALETNTAEASGKN
jgi:large subunit ribosomal protein L1